MIRLRRAILYSLHERLLDNDYPGVLESLSDPRPAVIKEAYRFVYGEEYADEEEDDHVVCIGDLSFDGDLNDDETVAELVTRISDRIHQLAPTELEVVSRSWWKFEGGVISG